MVWTAPMTAIAGDIFKASQFNTHVRDNLLETEMGLPVTGDDYFFVTTGVNSISASIPTLSLVATSQTTTSTTYTNLTTVGPTINDLNVNNKVLISVGADMVNNTSGERCRMSVEYSNDGTTVSATDTMCVANSGTLRHNIGASFVLTTVPGTYTFTAKYRVSAGTGTFVNRNLFIFPF